MTLDGSETGHHEGQMNSERPLEEVIFDAAIEIEDRGERAKFLDEACEGDEALRKSVASLLECDDTLGDFLETPAVAVHGGHDHTEGDRIDGYQLEERLGEGGFGVVWKAEQLEPVNRAVALKIIKLGMDTQQVIDRFDAERRALARMNHRHIATVFDAGQTMQGRPYVVIELIDGVAIDRHCDEQNLSIRDRLTLFVEICGAVQHAHQKGIVHQDLKPTNLLIASEDGRAIPKVIDFGIAKAFDAGHDHRVTADEHIRVLSDTTNPHLVGTPDYMSPEQILRHRDVDTRADVYSLGAVLYELLTGATPNVRSWLKNEPTDSWRDRLDSEQIVLPSNRVADNQVEIATRRSTDPSRLRRTLRDDLDWITKKALATEPSERYDSAAELARDVERYLDGRPVAAASAGRFYAAKRFAARNRVGVFASIVVLLAIIGGATAAGLGFLQARREQNRATAEWRRAEQEKQNSELERNIAEELRRRAERETEKAMRFAAVIEDLIGAADPTHGYPANFTVRENLDRIANDVGERLAKYPLIEARLRRLIGRVYYSLREFRKAEPQLRRALELTQSAVDPADDRIVKSATDHAGALFFVGRAAEASAKLDELLPRLREMEPSNERIDALFVKSRIEGLLDRHGSSDQYLEEAWQSSVRLHGPHHPITLRHQAQAARRLLGDDPEQAEAQVRSVYEKMMEARGTFHVDVAFALHQLAFVLSSCEKHAEADQLVGQATELYRQLLGEENPYLMAVHALHSKIKSDLGDEAAELQLARDAAALADAVGEENPSGQRNAYQRLAVASRLVDPAESITARGKSLSIQLRYFPRNRKMMYSLAEFAFRLRRAGRTQEALDAYTTAIASITAFETSGFQLIRVLHAAGDLCRELGDYDQAAYYFVDAIRCCDASLVRPIGRINLDRCVLEIELAEVLLMKNEGRTVDDRVVRLQENAVIPAEQLTIVAMRAQQRMSEQRFDEALKMLEDGLEQFTVRIPNRMSARLVARIGVIVAECHLHLGDYESCETHLLAAEERAGVRAYRPADRRRIRGQLVELYRAWGKDDQVEHWKEVMGVNSADSNDANSIEFQFRG